MTYIYKSPLQERDGDFKVTDGLITGATNANWDDAYAKRVDTWTFPLLYSSNVASISLTDTGIDHGGLAGLGDDDHSQYFADTTIGIRSKNYSTTGLVNVGNLIDTALNANEGVYTDSSSQLTSTPPTSGILGHWTRTGTVLSPANAGDDLEADQLALCGSVIANGVCININPGIGSPIDTGTSDFIGIDLQPFITHTAGSTITNVVGLNLAAFDYDNDADIVSLTGINAGVGTLAQSGDISFLRGIRISNAHVGSGTVDECSLFSGLNPAGGGTINTLFGMKLSAMTRGTTNWAIFSQGGNSAHSGNFRIGDLTVPTEALEVAGSIVQDESTGSRYLLRYSLMGA